MHSHDGVHFHSSHDDEGSAPGLNPQEKRMLQMLLQERLAQQQAGQAAQAMAAMPPQQQMMMYQVLMQQRMQEQQHGGHDGHGHGQHSHDGVNFHGDHGVQDHGHDHEQLDSPGKYEDREAPLFDERDWKERAFTVGIGGPVGSGKTALMLALCRLLHPTHNIACVTNDIFTKEDAEFLIKNEALPQGRIRAIETGGCPHAAIREDVSANLGALESLQEEFNCELLLIESGGDNLAANYSRELADFIIYVIDVSGGDKIPRKGGPGITQSDLLVINKTDLAELVGADLKVMERDAAKIRDGGPVIFSQVKNGKGVNEIWEEIKKGWKASGDPAAEKK
ncbi:hypothetical protein HK101_010118 [Irineochytrium annulatum]|nr:hypothetical protein HK101_010118 [Irineochytrium annulatum]